MNKIRPLDHSHILGQFYLWKFIDSTKFQIPLECFIINPIGMFHNLWLKIYFLLQENTLAQVLF